MKKISAVLMTLAMISDHVLAEEQGGFSGSTIQMVHPAGGFTGPATTMTTAKQAKTMPDDTWVTLRGKLESHIGGDHYIFRDSSGTINVDIDHNRWSGQIVTPRDLIEIQGELHKEGSSVEIDIKQITIVK